MNSIARRSGHDGLSFLKPPSRTPRWPGLLLLLLLLPPSAASAQTAPGSGYQLPPKALQAIVDAPRPPQMFTSPKRDLVALVQTPSLPGIEVVAQPELKLAGLRIHPRTRAQSRFTFGTGLSLLDIASGKS